ncbi:hypothetical protein SCG7086_AC_00070 [Chlamydiales bacterium SCGC AG-110-P3]|nr:hypothetical protein SCG7086_AC_00070 [Chlamydiales bacterium SCGC AG-110-P3]
MDSLLKEVGITGGDINGLTQPLIPELDLNSSQVATNHPSPWKAMNR